MDNISVKKNIAGIRIRKGLSQEAAAEKMGISRTAYRNIESGDTRLISDSIGKMAEVFGVSAEEILLGYEPVREDSDLLKDMKMRYGEKNPDNRDRPRRRNGAAERPDQDTAGVH